MTVTGLFYVELAQDMLLEGKWFDGMAVGEFTDMWGRDFEFEQDELPEFLKNTLAAIASTKSESGDIVGLPIDAEDHQGGQASGWIVDAAIEGEKVRLLPKWTDIGQELISSGRMRFFSPTINLKKKVLVGGTLTNWPATRDEDEKILLRPIELSKQLFVTERVESGVLDTLTNLVRKLQGVKFPEAPKGNEEDMKFKDLTKEQRAELGAEVLASELGADLGTVELGGRVSELIDARVAKDLESKLKAAERATDIAEFSKAVIGGDDKNKVGLPVTAERLEDFLGKLGEGDLYDEGKALFKTIHESGLVVFSTIGHDEEVEGKSPLPQEFADALKSGELKLADLENDMAGLGDLSQYDLSAFKEKE